MFLHLIDPQWMRHPSTMSALLWGSASVLIPWLVLQPAFGAGLASAKLADPWQSRAFCLAGHLVFGVNLYANAELLAAGCWLLAKHIVGRVLRALRSAIGAALNGP